MAQLPVCFRVETKNGKRRDCSTAFSQEPGSHHGSPLLAAPPSFSPREGGPHLALTYLRMTDNRHSLLIPAAALQSGILSQTDFLSKHQIRLQSFQSAVSLNISQLQECNLGENRRKTIQRHRLCDHTQMRHQDG